MTTQPTLKTIPLNRLIPSKANVRRTGAKDGLDELAASIAAHGLRQNLSVRPVAESDRFEVVAGGRRLAALKRLAKEGLLPKDAPIPCAVLAEGDDPAEISLTENVTRLAMHPDDQFEAFQHLASKGLSPEDIAARFGVMPAVVERRLKLARVSPKLRAAFRKGTLTLEQMMAFAISDDHAAQEATYRSLSDWNRSPRDIRASLIEEALPLSHPVARFVGEEAYLAAGGVILRDLFASENAAYLPDRALALRLAQEKLDAALNAVAAEGWKWVKAEPERDWTTRYGRIRPLDAREDLDEEAESEERPLAFDPEDMARAGAVLRIGHDGSLSIERGLIHPDDLKPEPKDKDDETAERDPTALPASLVAELTAHRTAALRVELAARPQTALAVTVHAMLVSLYEPGRRTVLALTLASEPLERHVRVEGDCPAHKAFRELGEIWASVLPRDPEEWFGWCLVQPQTRLLDLLAFLAASGLNAVRSKFDSDRSPRLAHADQLVEALGLDMAAHWQGSAEGFYARLTKTQLVAAVSEAQAPMQVSVSGLKKQDAARYVAKAMDGRGWLPVPLRRTGVEAEPEPLAEAA